MTEVTLVLATITTGLMAGLFFAYSCSVMPALRGAGDREFIDAMRRINRAIQNGVFLLAFGGALLAGGAAVVLDLLDGAGFDPLTPTGVALYVVTVAITFGINIPLNNRLDAAGDPDRIADPAAVRRAFEARWVRWNTVRTLASTAGFACLCAALAS
ncbi:anthrone oxygenase family protein [Actinokineospora sp.]|uniref:anthrone oxygenase family protein n=1 Tax=Actinokineospora sp. TaxID=1872133 RepID=UPI004037FAC0